MSVTMIRATVNPGSQEVLEEAVTKLFATIEEVAPQGIRYASTRLQDGGTWVILLQLDDGVEDPLPSVPGFAEFQATVRSHLAAPPVAEELTVVGSYNLF